MRQTLHLLILDADDQRRVLAAWHDRLWVLPILDVTPRMRGEAATHTWLAARGLRGAVIGQWVGRLTQGADAMDSLMVVCVQSVSTRRLTGLAWTPLRTLLSSAHVLDYQCWALQLTAPSGEVPATNGPFGDTGWPDEAARFIRDALALPEQDISLVPHRATSSELVLECRTKSGRYFAKGLARERAFEAAFTFKMHQMAPESFACTRAFAGRPDGSVWWLMEACRGEPLTEHLTPDACSRVAMSYAKLQRQVGSSASIMSMLPAFEPIGLAVWVEAVLENAGCRELADRCRTLVEEACAIVEASAMARSWIAADLDPLNVLISADEIRFIDLDDALCGLVSMGASILARRVRRAAPECVEPLRDAYAREWPASVAISGSWHTVDLLAAILECHLEWQRLQTQTERGEVYGLLDHARSVVVNRLTRLCDAAPFSAPRAGAR